MGAVAVGRTGATGVLFCNGMRRNRKVNTKRIPFQLVKESNGRSIAGDVFREVCTTWCGDSSLPGWIRVAHLFEFRRQSNAVAPAGKRRR